MCGTSPRQLMDESPSSDVLLWRELEEKSWAEHDKIDYYFAQIAWVTALSGGATNVKVEDFLMKFGREKEVEMSQYEGMQNSISVWEVATGKKATSR
jgi:hypothetical protein